MPDPTGSRFAPYHRITPRRADASPRRAWQRLLNGNHGQGQPKVATLLIHRLSLGGAERQICHLALALERLGWRVRVITIYPTDDKAHLLHNRLDEAGIAVANLAHPDGMAEDNAAWADSRLDDDQRAMLAPLPGHLLHCTIATWRLLEDDRPELVVGFLDFDNMRAALAGLLAGLPRIALCGRSLHPDTYPHLQDSSMALARSLYRLTLRSPRISLLNNSRAGAESYAGWLGIDPKRITIMPNILEPDQPRPHGLRRELGIAEDIPLVAGVLRFSPEKRPGLFVDVVERLSRRFPDLVAVIAGDGMLRAEVSADIERRNLGRSIHLLGPRPDSASVMAAADLVLHVSRYEGLPNTVLEAQALGRPVVATRAGGTEDAMAAILHPYLCEPDDVEALTEACARLLNDKKLARRLGDGARAEITGRFTPERVTDALLAAVDLTQNGRL